MLTCQVFCVKLLKLNSYFKELYVLFVNMLTCSVLTVCYRKGVHKGVHCTSFLNCFLCLYHFCVFHFINQEISVHIQYETQWARVVITSLLRRNYAATSFCRNNDVIITLCVRWEMFHSTTVRLVFVYFFTSGHPIDLTRCNCTAVTIHDDIMTWKPFIH